MYLFHQSISSQNIWRQLLVLTLKRNSGPVTCAVRLLEWGRCPRTEEAGSVMFCSGASLLSDPLIWVMAGVVLGDLTPHLMSLTNVSPFTYRNDVTDSALLELIPGSIFQSQGLAGTVIPVPSCLVSGCLGQGRGKLGR